MLLKERKLCKRKGQQYLTYQDIRQCNGVKFQQLTEEIDYKQLDGALSDADG